MKRPKIKIKKDFYDWIIEAFTVAFLLLVALMPIYYLAQIANLDAMANGFAKTNAAFHKKTLLAIPVIGTGLCAILFYINKFPHTFNYPTAITTTNATRQYTLAGKFVRRVCLVISATFCYIGFATIQASFGGDIGHKMFLLPVFLATIFGVVALYLRQATKHQAQ